MPVTPAKAGVQKSQSARIGTVVNDFGRWMPAFAGITEVKALNCVSPMMIGNIAKYPPPDKTGLQSDFPRTIWMLWHQGWENAPELVQRCRRSWEYHNPGWTIHALDAENLADYVDLSELSLPLDKGNLAWLSDLVRINLLRTHGGVWADATTFCNRPLNEWLYDHLGSGFFSFERGGGAIGWFMAAAPGNPLVDIWRREAHTYWKDAPPQLWLSQTRHSFAKRLMDAAYFSAGRPRPRAIAYTLRLLGMFLRTFPVFLLSPLFRNVLKVAHYYWLYFIFKKCYKTHRQFRQIWDRTPKVPAVGLIELGGMVGLAQPISADRKLEIDERLVSVYKLNWRLDPAKVVPGTFAHYLLATIPR